MARSLDRVLPGAEFPPLPHNASSWLGRRISKRGQRFWNPQRVHEEGLASDKRGQAELSADALLGNSEVHEEDLNPHALRRRNLDGGQITRCGLCLTLRLAAETRRSCRVDGALDGFGGRAATESGRFTAAAFGPAHLEPPG